MITSISNQLNLALFGAFLISPGHASDQVLPKPFPINRYDDLWATSPFAGETAPSAIAETKKAASFARDLVISGVIDVDGIETVVVRNSRTTETFTASSDESGDFELVSVNINRDRRQTTAVIATEGDSAEIRFAKQTTSPVGGQTVPSMPSNSPDNAQNQLAKRFTQTTRSQVKTHTQKNSSPIPTPSPQPAPEHLNPPVPIAEVPGLQGSTSTIGHNTTATAEPSAPTSSSRRRVLLPGQ